MYNMNRKKEIETGNAFASVSTGDYSDLSKEIIELQNKYINEEIDAEELQKLSFEVALKELKAAFDLKKEGK